MTMQDKFDAVLEMIEGPQGEPVLIEDGMPGRTMDGVFKEVSKGTLGKRPLKPKGKYIHVFTSRLSEPVDARYVSALRKMAAKHGLGVDVKNKRVHVFREDFDGMELWDDELDESVADNIFHPGAKHSWHKEALAFTQAASANGRELHDSIKKLVMKIKKIGYGDKMVENAIRAAFTSAVQANVDMGTAITRLKSLTRAHKG